VKAVIDDWRTAPLDAKLRSTLGFLEKLTLGRMTFGPPMSRRYEPPACRMTPSKTRSTSARLQYLRPSRRRARLVSAGCRGIRGVGAEPNEAGYLL